MAMMCLAAGCCCAGGWLRKRFRRWLRRCSQQPRAPHHCDDAALDARPAAVGVGHAYAGLEPGVGVDWVTVFGAKRGYMREWQGGQGMRVLIVDSPAAEYCYVRVKGRERHRPLQRSTS